MKTICTIDTIQPNDSAGDSEQVVQESRQRRLQSKCIYIYIYLSNILIYDMHIYNVYNTEKNDDDDDDDGNEKLY